MIYHLSRCTEDGCLHQRSNSALGLVPVRVMMFLVLMSIMLLMPMLISLMVFATVSRPLKDDVDIDIGAMVLMLAMFVIMHTFMFVMFVMFAVFLLRMVAFVVLVAMLCSFVVVWFEVVGVVWNWAACWVDVGREPDIAGDGAGLGCCCDDCGNVSCSTDGYESEACCTGCEDQGVAHVPIRLLQKSARRVYVGGYK